MSVGLSSVCADTSKSSTPVTSWTRPEIAAPTCAVPPRIDGILDDACWKTAAHAPVFFRLTSPVTEQTEAWICADSTHLYVAFHCLDNQPQSIKASETQRNGNTWIDDYVAVDIDSQNNHRNYSQFIVNARGTQNENLEGGTASNITWAGDWHAATYRTADGWNAEFSIPFALLRYPPGTHSFGIQLERKLARETSSEIWPNRPAISRVHAIEYFGELTGISPQLYRPEPLFLPYVLATAGDGSSVKEGIDIKYPLTSGLTGVATINPDFSTVEQNVTNIAFSYTPQYISDQRPFFDEGSGFFPGSDIFYSPSIGGIDGGVKVTGKEGGTALGILATDESGPDYQFARTMQLQQDLNPLSTVGFDYAGDNQAGLESNQVAAVSGNFGWHAGRGLLLVNAEQVDSWVGNQEQGGEVYDRIFYRGAPGHPSFGVIYNGVAPNFVSDLGFVPQLDYKGPTYVFRQNNTFDQGWLKSYGLYAGVSKQEYWTGGFFRDSDYVGGNVLNREGNRIGLEYSDGQRIDYRDHLGEIWGDWNENSQFGGGGIDYLAGTQEDQHYRYWDVSQGYGFAQKLNASVEYVYQTLGPVLTTQLVFTPQYRLTSERSIGGRIVNQNHQTDVYLLYEQQARTGSDIYLLFGNPNSEATEGLVTLKVVTPF
jgi:hypothetical protein